MRTAPKEIRSLRNAPSLSKGRWVAALAMLLLFPVPLMAQERNNTPAHALLGPFGGPKAFPETYRRALNVFINAENTYFKGDYAAADALLKKLWADVPPSSPPWYEASEPERAAISSSGLNIGSPPCYYALRMLTDCVAWRLGGGTPGEAVGITWTVVMPGHVESRSRVTERNATRAEAKSRGWISIRG